MKVKIREKGGKGFTLYIPMSLVGVAFRIANYWISRGKGFKDNEWINCVDLKVLGKELKSLNKKYKGLTLVEAQSKDGDMVKIVL